MIKDNNKTRWMIWGGAAALVGGAAVYFLLIENKKSEQYGNKTGKHKATGTGSTTENTGTTLTGPDWNNPFDKDYAEDVKKWMAPKTVLTLGETDARSMARAIHEAKGESWWNDDNEEVVADIFKRRLRDKVQVANLSQAFWKLYQKDMWKYLKGFLSNGEMENLVQAPVRNLQNYRTA